jgi:hypothetical protein
MDPESAPIDLGPYQSVFTEQHREVFQAPQKLAYPMEAAPTSWISNIPAAQAPFKGKERSIPLALVLSLLTCGVYGFVWMYHIGHDLRTSLRQSDPRPALDVFLTVLTCGLWGIFVAYRYPVLITELQQRRGLRKNDVSLVSVLLALFGIWGVYGLGLVSLALIQNELNKVWRSLSRGEGR